MFIRNRWWEGIKRCCCCSVAQSCSTLCSPINCSMPGLPVPHHFLKFAQVHVHCISDAVQLSRPLTPSSFQSFIQLMRFSRLASWGGLPFSSPEDHVLLELSALIHPSWVALHGMAHSLNEFCKPLRHDKAVIHEEGGNMCTCVILAKQYKAESDSEINWIFSFIFQIARKKQNMLIVVSKRTD